jgi:hypothetical protein
LRRFLVIAIKGFIKLFVSTHFTWPLVCIYSRVIEEVQPKTGKGGNDKPTILTLNSHRFRGDLEILANSNKCRLLQERTKSNCH